MDMPHDRNAHPPIDGERKGSYETPLLRRLGSVADVTQGVPSPQVDVLFVGSL
jgi:hypothetical protein